MYQIIEVSLSADYTTNGDNTLTPVQYLEHQVSLKINEGWECLGAPVYIHHQVIAKLLQAMIKR